MVQNITKVSNWSLSEKHRNRADQNSTAKVLKSQLAFKLQPTKVGQDMHPEL